MCLEIKHRSLIQHKRATMFKSMSVFPVTSFTSFYTNFQPHQMTFKLYLAASCCRALTQAVLCLKCHPSLCLLNSFLSFRSSSNFIPFLFFFPQTYNLRELLQSYFFQYVCLFYYIESSLRALIVFHLYFMSPVLSTQWTLNIC